MDKNLEKFKEQTKSELKELGEELRAQLTFIRISIKEDRENLEAYKKEFGDLKYRPKYSDGTYGDPTESALNPLVNSYKTTIQTLLNSLAIIEIKLDNKEIPTKKTGNGEEFDANKWLNDTKKEDK